MNAAANTEATWNHEASQTESVEQLLRRAMTLVDGRGLTTSPAKVARIVRAYVRRGGPRVDFDAYFLTYSDPTGETAVRHLMAGTR